MPDTGASSHFTPCLSDMKEVEEGLDLGVEVADGHIVQCTARGIVEINMIADDGLTLKAFLHGVIYVPGLKRRLFSVTAFASRGHYAIVRKNEIQLMFGNEGRPLTLMLRNGMPIANNATLKQSVSIPEYEQQKHKKKIDLELAHARFIRPSRALLAASSAEVWNDLSIRMSPDSDCISCRISTMKATARIKHPSTPVSKPGQVIYLDILPAVSDDSLTPKSYFPDLLILVDAFSRFTRVIGMSNKSTKSITAALSVFAAEHRLISSVKLWKIEKIKGDAGSEFNSTEFEQFCLDRRISVSFASPKHQEGNHFAERTWQSLRKLAQSMLVHARLPDMYMYHALLHACHVFNVLPLKDLVTGDGIITTPYELFVGSKPRVGHFRVFGCPCIAKKWTISVHGKPEDNSKGTQRGIRGIHLGFSPTQKG